MSIKVKKIGVSLRNEMDTFRNVLNKKNQEISQLMIAQLDQHEGSLQQIQLLYNQRFKDLRDSDGAAGVGEGHDMSKKL
jgi:hypothetical protein